MTTTTNKPAANSINGLTRHLGNVAWWTDARGTWLKLSQPEQRLDTAPDRALIIVVAREAYQERWESFSIRSESELRRVLNLRDHGQSVFHWIGPWVSGQRQVLTVRWNATATALLPRATIVLPESLLIAKAVEPGFYAVTRDRGYYLLKQRTQQWQTVQRSALVGTEERARLALGGAAIESVQNLTNSVWASLLQRGLTQIGVSTYWQSWTSRQQQVRESTQFPWSAVGMGAAVVAVLYGLLSSAYLMFALSSAESTLADLGPDLDRALQAQDTVLNAQQQLATVQQHQSDLNDIDRFWRVVADLQALDVKINTMTSDYRELTFAGEGRDAINKLGQLIAKDYIKTADFVSPVRTQRNGLERFTVTITFAEEAGE